MKLSTFPCESKWLLSTLGVHDEDCDDEAVFVEVSVKVDKYNDDEIDSTKYNQRWR